MRTVISREAQSLGESAAKLLVQRYSLKDDETRRCLERFIAVYEAVLQATQQHDAALYVASSEARPLLSAKPASRRYRYPGSANDLLKEVDLSASVLAGYLSSLRQTAEERVNTCRLDSLVYAGRTYVLHAAIEEQKLVGLEREEALLRKYVRQLFLYDAETMSNPDSGRFPKTVLLTGPPGTGKTSLFKLCIAEAKRLEQLTAKKSAVDAFDASNFSSYFGKSARILKQKLNRVQDPSGVGLFCIEDVDMVFQSREDNNAYHGVLQVQQYLMNFLSGLQPYYGNTITFLSTNRPASLDHALESRMQSIMHVNPFSELETHAAYWRMQFPNLESKSVATASHSAGLSGRDMESICSLARESTTRAPTDEELLQKAGHEQRYGAVTAELLETLIGERMS